MKTKLFLSALLILASTTLAKSQSNIPFQVNINYPFLSISQEQLNEANTLSDLNHNFKNEWVREYLSVEISTLHNGKLLKEVGENNHLNQVQKEFLKDLQLPAIITVKVQYIPENSLKHNQPKEEVFSFSINPAISASYKGGHDKLESYLQKNAVSKIPGNIFKEYDLAIIKFTINEMGQIIDAFVFQSSKDQTIDELLLKTVCGMSDWNPAQHANGKKVKQEFVFTIGNHKSCNINLVNTINNMY